MNETTQIKPIKKVKKPSKKVGRPKINLNLEELERLSRLNCTMPEISAYFDIPLRTLEDKFTNEQDVRKAIEKGRATGKLSLRRRQIQIMEETNNPTMAIWLGKQMLGQTDRQEIIQDINIEERKVLDISRLTDDDLNYLERTLKHALVDPDTGGENAQVPQVIHQRGMGNDRAKS
jgi:hypothetical protein|tara:strand:+ start:354 stop:881 length:528 start_codon:yes stop_codon:yes gene_type:complete